MSWVRVWIHLVFSTKNRTCFFTTKELRSMIFEHIKQNAGEKNIWLDCLNGYHDHVHCLVSLRATQSISEIARLIKGESSFWINKNKLTTGKFSWQDDYWAASISERHLKQVRKYIHSQEKKHRLIHFSKEIDLLIEKYGWELIKE